MGQTPKDLQPTRSVLHFLGAEIRRLRLGAGMSQADLGKALFVHKDLIRRVEAAERTPSDDLVEQCDATLGANGRLHRLLPMLQRERVLRPARDVGGAASGFRSEATDRPVLDWLLSTAPVRRSDAADQHAAADQLRVLREADHRHGAGLTYPGLARTLAESLEALTRCAPQVAVGYLELAGYEAVDLGNDGMAQQRYLRALEIATGAGDRLYGGYLIAVSLGHLALHCGDPEQAARLARASLRGIGTAATPAIRAACRTVLARAHARRGERVACAAALLLAERDLARSRRSEEPSWIAYFGEADLGDERAHCFFDLGLHAPAQREAAQAVAALEPHRIRRKAIDSALSTASLARSRQVDHACAMARQAIDHATAISSFRSAHRIVLMLAELQPYSDQPEVRDVVEYAHTRLPVLVNPAMTSPPS
ncbi:helix-turn-helix domain-containing protein [Krasilnikovia sp. MM14-A1259]|uniref:helix-turn-helix domain-containing protein n=1 Tax=Krasilnikovia sp. MM14-A1259 TaxID=3373539 RepID=UPI00382C158D